jgi:hypothetical protein
VLTGCCHKRPRVPFQGQVNFAPRDCGGFIGPGKRRRLCSHARLFSFRSGLKDSFVVQVPRIGGLPPAKAITRYMSVLTDAVSNEVAREVGKPFTVEKRELPGHLVRSDPRFKKQELQVHHIPH